MEQGMVPQIHIDAPMTNPDAQAMRLTGDTSTDLQSVAKELGLTLDANGNAVTQPKPVTSPHVEIPTQAVSTPKAVEIKPEAPVEVPAKFQNPDGTVNVEKLEKSTASLDEMIAKYRAKETAAQTLQNKVNNPNGNPVNVAPATPQAQLTPFEVQVANDLITEAAAAGYQMPQGQAIAQAKIAIKLSEARAQFEQQSSQELRQRLEDGERARELDSMVKSDPWLATEAAVDALWKVRQENPWLNQAPKPWEAAYTFFKGRNGHGSQVQTPTPTGNTAQAKPTPVAPVARVQRTVDVTDKRALESLSDADLEAIARKFNPGLRLK